MVVIVFSAVSMVSSFEVDKDTYNLVGMGEKTHRYTHTQLYASLSHIDLVRFRMKAEHSCFIQTELKKSSSSLAVSTHTLGPVHLRRGGGHF